MKERERERRREGWTEERRERRKGEGEEEGGRERRRGREREGGNILVKGTINRVEATLNICAVKLKVVLTVFL